MLGLEREHIPEALDGGTTTHKVFSSMREDMQGILTEGKLEISSNCAGLTRSSSEEPKSPATGTLASPDDSVSSSVPQERCVLGISSEEALRINSVKMKSKGQRSLHIEEPEIF